MVSTGRRPGWIESFLAGPRVYRSIIVPNAVCLLACWICLTVPARAQTPDQPGTPPVPTDLLVTPPLSTPTPADSKTSNAQDGQPSKKPGESASARSSTGSGDTAGYQVSFKDGILFTTTDGLFSLQFHDLTQIDGRAFSPAHTVRDQFNITREWLIFRGNVTEYADYTAILAAGVVGSLNILDAYFDLNPLGENKDPLQVRIGRFQTPFGYQWYKIVARNLVANERSMFMANFSPNRELGAMGHGVVLDGRLDYALGLFNGVRNSFNVPFSGKEETAFVNALPFLLEEGSPFRYLNIGLSFDTANQNGGLSPNALRTANQGPAGPENDVISPTFLKFNPNVVEIGVRDAGAVDVVWFYRGFQFLGEYTAGFEHYGLTSAPGKKFPVSLSGYSFTGSYFLTGEEPTGRGPVVPLHPWGKGCGAVEGFGRFSNLILGQNVFAADLADPEQWANGVDATDVGLNWYPNRFLRLTLDWQHAMFNRPVQPAGAPVVNSQDLYWLRFQLYY